MRVYLYPVMIIIIALFTNVSVRCDETCDSLCKLVAKMTNEGSYKKAIKIYEDNKTILTNKNSNPDKFRSDPNYLYIYIARSYSAMKEKSKTLEYLNLYINNVKFESKNRLLLFKEFANLYEDDSFQSLMTENDDYINESYHDAKNEERQKSKCNFEEVKDYFERLSSGIDEEIKNRSEIEKCIKYYDKELYDIFIMDQSNVKYKLLLAIALINSRDSILRKNVINAISRYDIKQYPEILYQIAYRAAMNDPKESLIFLRMLFQANGSNMALPDHSMNIDWKSLLAIACGVSQPNSDIVLQECARSSNINTRMNALEIMTVLKTKDALPGIVKMFKETDKDSIRNYLVNLIILICRKESLQTLDSLKKDYPSYSNIFNAAKDSITHIVALNKNFKINKPDMGSSDPDFDNIIEKITNPKIKNIFLDNLIKGNGNVVSYFPHVIANSCTKDDIAKLIKLRNRILTRMSDEGYDDYFVIEQILTRLEWND